MAFQQPQQRPQAPRPHLNVTDQPKQASPSRKRSIEESQEWILFSPAPNADVLSVAQTSQTPRTATHLSDFGSLETRGRSRALGSSNVEDDHFTSQETDVDDEAAELDSLDDGLHAFHQPFLSSTDHLDQSGGAVLPTHDGFGTFPSSAGLQEHLWQFERFNPQRRSRHLRPRSSARAAADPMEEGHELSIEDDRTARIEQWRMDQSKVVLEEIERETRRRRRRLSRLNGGSVSLDTRSMAQDSVASATLRSHATTSTDDTETQADASTDSESFWRRITRRVMRDLMGLDETMLSVIFGEQLVSDSSPTPTQPSPIAAAIAQESRVSFNDSAPTWQVKLLERIARELGILVHQISEHDGAFHTYRHVQEAPGYAGLPWNTPRQPSFRQQQQQRRLGPLSPSPADNLFSPTVVRPPTLSPAEPADTALWGIDEEPEPGSLDPDLAAEDADSKREREFWEREIDVKMIFNYLKSRFSSASPPAPAPSPHASADNPSPPLPASWATASGGTSGLAASPESQRRAEVIRRQHPLVSRAAAAQSRRRESLLLLRRHHHHRQSLLQKRGGGPAGAAAGVAVAVAGGSSCASQSTNRRSRHSRSASSRHYWDLGGSVGSLGSGPAMSSGLGGWGEV